MICRNQGRPGVGIGRAELRGENNGIRGFIPTGCDGSVEGLEGLLKRSIQVLEQRRDDWQKRGNREAIFIRCQRLRNAAGPTEKRKYN